MPNIDSAKKRVRVTERKTARNKAYKSAVRTAVKNAISAESAEKETVVKVALKKLDQAVTKGVMHKNTAARKKSRIVRRCAG